MEPATWISLGALTVAILGWLLNAYKAYRERRTEVEKERDGLTKVGAERDNIAVHSAEAALLLMEKMLNQSNASAEKASQRADQLELRLNDCVDKYAVLQRDCHREDS